MWGRRLDRRHRSSRRLAVNRARLTGRSDGDVDGVAVGVVGVAAAVNQAATIHRPTAKRDGDGLAA